MSPGRVIFISFSIAVIMTGCSGKQIDPLPPPDISGVEIPVFKNIRPKEINVKVVDQRHATYSSEAGNELISEYFRIVTEVFRQSGFRVHSQASNGISFYIREERYRKRLRKDCIKLASRLRARSGKWINIQNASCAADVGYGNYAMPQPKRESAFPAYLEMFKDALDRSLRLMNDKVLEM